MGNIINIKKNLIINTLILMVGVGWFFNFYDSVPHDSVVISKQQTARERSEWGGLGVMSPIRGVWGLDTVILK